MADVAFDRLAKSVAFGIDRRRLLRGVFGAAVFGTGRATGIETRAAPVDASPVQIDYVALGDSIASGHGLGDVDGPDPEVCCTPPGVDACRVIAGCCQTCRRSPRSYPYRVAGLLAAPTAPAPSFRIAAFAHLACTGSGLIDPHNPNLLPIRLFRSQVEAALDAVSSRPTLVSVTIGSNDFEWFDPLRAALHLVVQDDDRFAAWVAERTTLVGERLREDLGRLLAVPNVVVVLTDLYNPFNGESWFFASNGLTRTACARRHCSARVVTALATINATYGGLVAELQATYGTDRVALAPIGDRFRGHEAPRGAVDGQTGLRSPCCGAAPPDIADTWIQYRDDPDSNSFPCLGEGWRGDCFHPNAAGADFIAGRVAEAGRRLLAASTRLAIMGTSWRCRGGARWSIPET